MPCWGSLIIIPKLGGMDFSFTFLALLFASLSFDDFAGLALSIDLDTLNGRSGIFHTHIQLLLRSFILYDFFFTLLSTIEFIYDPTLRAQRASD